MGGSAAYKLVPIHLFAVGVAFACGSCGRPLTIRLDELAGPFTCRQCNRRIDVPPIACIDETCGGRHEICGGSITRLTGDALERERAAAWEGEPAPSGRPSDDEHERIGEIEASVRAWRCSRCGAQYSNAAAVSGRFDTQGRTRCKRAVCGRCLRAPTWDELKARE